MKRNIAIILIFATAFFLVSCNKGASKKVSTYFSTTTNQISNTQNNLTATGAPLTSPTPSVISEKTTNDLKWLSFTLTGFAEERSIVRKHFEKEIKDIENGKYGANKTVDIAISLEDINGDKKKEIIAILFHRYFSGAKTNGLLGVFISSNENIQYIQLPQVFVDSDKIEEQKEIGIKSSTTTNWKVFLVNGVEWHWQEGKYINGKK